MYTITTTTWTMKKVLKEVKANTINFRCGVQRGFVWDIGRQSLLIHSLLKGDIIPSLFIRRMPEDAEYKMEARDGQQRCTTVYRFMTGQFKLNKIPVYHDGDKFDFRIARGEKGELEDINGLSWDDLTEDEQDRIKDATITIYYIDGATDEEADMIFFKLNNGKPLTNTELIRAEARSRDIIKSLGQHELFHKMFSDKTLINGTFDVITKMWCMLNEDEPNLMSDHIKKLIKTVEITPDDAKKITDVLDFALMVHGLVSVVKIAKRMITKTHFLSLVPIFYKALEDDINPATFVKFIESFYDGKTTKEPTINEAYNNNFLDSSASKSRIRVRHNALMNHYEKTFNGEKEDIYSTDINEFLKQEEEEKEQAKKEKDKGVNYDEVIDLSSMPAPQETEAEPEPKKEEKKVKPVKKTAEPKVKEDKTDTDKTTASVSKKEEKTKTMSVDEYNKMLDEKRAKKAKEKLGIAPF